METFGDVFGEDLHVNWSSQGEGLGNLQVHQLEVACAEPNILPETRVRNWHII